MRVRLLSIDVTVNVIVQIFTVKIGHRLDYSQSILTLHFKFSISHKSDKIKYLTLDLRKRRNQIKCDKILKDIDCKKEF